MSQQAWYQKRAGRFGKSLSLAERYYERGLHYFEKNKLDLALADLDAALEQDPKRAEYYVARGMILLQSQRPDEAEEDFAYGLKLDPMQWLAHYGRGMRAFEEGKYEDAISYFSRAQKVDPNRPEIYSYRAVAFCLVGKGQEALRDAEVALQLLKPEDKLYKDAEKWLATFRKECK